MFESNLDAMVREKIERIVNAMPDASGQRDRQDNVRILTHFRIPSLTRKGMARVLCTIFIRQNKKPRLEEITSEFLRTFGFVLR